MTRCVQVVVHGRVQGVSYRYWTRSEAERHGVTGWVRNRSDGTVEAMLAGEAASVRAMVEAMNEGPRLAQVESVEIVSETDDADAPASFEIKSTFQVR